MLSGALMLGADMFDISSGGLITGVKIPSGPGYQVPLAEHVAAEISEPVAAVGQITDAHQAEKILAGWTCRHYFGWSCEPS